MKLTSAGIGLFSDAPATDDAAAVDFTFTGDSFEAAPSSER
ncbi:MAG: hypothetical protein ACFB2X_07755 [Rivularia sp. (in: cyanobacteria)]